MPKPKNSKTDAIPVSKLKVETPVTEETVKEAKNLSGGETTAVFLPSRLREKYEGHIAKIANPDTDVEVIKEISCKFFRLGGNPMCAGCAQDEDTVRECASNYAENILERPMTHWKPEFNELRVREKTRIKDLGRLGLNCNSCYIAERCPLMKVDSMCAIDWELNDEKIKQPKDGIDTLIALQWKRIARLTAIEDYDGGVADLNLSTEMDRLTSLYKDRADLDRVHIKMTMEGSAPVHDDGRPKEPGVLERLFGGMLKKPEQAALPDAAPPIVTDIPHEEVVLKDKEKK